MAAGAGRTPPPNPGGGGRPAKRKRAGRAKVWAGKGEVEAGEMDESSVPCSSAEWEEMRSRFKRDGYLLIRGLLPRDEVLKVRRRVLGMLAEERPEVFQGPPEEGLAVEGTQSIGLIGRQHVARSPGVCGLLEHEALFSLAGGIIGCAEPITTGFKWLRAVAREEFTGVHTDRVFLGRGSAGLVTVWLPLGDVPREEGAMMVCRASHRSRAFARLREGYGSGEVGGDGTASGWLSDNGADVAGAVGAVDWRTCDFRAGDAVVLALDTMHMTAANKTDRIRLSCDTRWQAPDEPTDERIREWRRRGGKIAVRN